MNKCETPVPDSKTFTDGIYEMLEKALTDEELYAMMKASPEFEHLPKPASWFKKFGLEPIKARNFKEYLDEDAWMESRGKPVQEWAVFKDPQPGGVRPVLPSEEIPVEIISRPVPASELWGVEDAAKKELEAKATLVTAEVLSEGGTVAPK
jgi:hypothetical protein